MFKVKEIKTSNIIQVLDTYCDEYGKTWFLFWENDGWRWRAADKYCPPNYTPKLKTIIAGSRTINNYLLIAEILNKKRDEISEVICGEAKGVDTLGRTWAIKNNIKVSSFPAEWDKYGATAGFRRNHQMGDYADKLIAFWDGHSTGTKDMIDYMQKLKKPVEVIEVKK